MTTGEAVLADLTLHYAGRALDAPKTVDDALDFLQAVLDARRRETVTRMLLDGVDPDDVDAFLAERDRSLANWRDDARAQIEAMLARAVPQ